MTREVRAGAAGVMIALLMLALLSSRASPGFPLADLPQAVGKAVVQAIGGAAQGAGRRAAATGRAVARQGASSFALRSVSV